MDEIGVEAIRAKSKRQVQRLIELAAEQGLPANTPADPERRELDQPLHLPLRLRADGRDADRGHDLLPARAA